jgi:hypothetical protein
MVPMRRLHMYLGRPNFFFPIGFGEGLGGIFFCFFS